jgi:hypothetical protein
LLIRKHPLHSIILVVKKFILDLEQVECFVQLQCQNF